MTNSVTSLVEYQGVSLNTVISVGQPKAGPQIWPIVALNELNDPKTSQKTRPQILNMSMAHIDWI